MRIQTSKKYISRYFFLVLALIATGCRNNSAKENKQEVKQTQQYRCPMHHEIIRDKPGTCPICGMDLVVFGGGGKSGNGGFT
jgi:Cu(I)/Ag(I) efflux system membrane fusion protein